MTTEELNQIKNERDEMEKHMTDMFDLAFMINNHDDLAKSQEHHEKLSRMVTHYMGSIQQSYGYMSEKAIKALEREPCADAVSREEAAKVLRADPSFICTGDKAQAITDILSLPPVTPERPKGEWIWKERIKGGFATYTGENVESGERVSVYVDERIKTKVNYCSVCGKRGDDRFFNFCPICGSYNGQTLEE